MHVLLSYFQDGHQNHVYTVMQSNGNNYCGDVVLDSFNIHTGMKIAFETKNMKANILESLL